MPNPDPYQARVAQRERAKRGKEPLDLQEVQRLMSEFIEALHAHVSGPEANPDRLSKIGYLFIQAIGTYTKLAEVGELESRHKAMEARMHALEQEARNARIPA
jgi:hypothetical protein